MNVKELFESYNKVNVLVLGDVIIDRYLYGKVDRISPEAPVPIVHLKNTDNRLGGAANVALNVKAMGATPFLFSVIGQDENAEMFQKLMPENNLWADGILQSKDRCTTVKTRVMSNNQQLLRVDREDKHDLTENEQKQLLEKIKLFLDVQPIDVIILQDYNKGVFSLPMIQRILKEGWTRDIPIVVDPKKNHFFEFRSVEIFKPNLKEIRESIPFDIKPNLESLQKASDYLRSESKCKSIVITLSEKGMFIDDGNQSKIIPTQVRNIADVCGAGDSVISLTALSLALKLNLEDIAVLSNLAGGQVCERVGVVPIDKKQLEEEYTNLVLGI